MPQMRILVTGGAGFIGVNICKIFLKRGHTVVAIDNLITSDGSNLNTLKHFPRFTFMKADITKPFPKTVRAPRFRFHEIYHLACPTGVDNLLRLGEEMLRTCAIGTRNVLEFARTHRSNVLFASSSEIYGDPQVTPQTEEYTGNVNPIGVRSTYEEGKRFAESLVSLYVRKYELDCRIVRIFNTYGPGMSDTDSRVIPRFLHQAQTGEPLTVHGKGTQKRTFCYVDDLVRGLLIVMKRGKPGEVYNLGSLEQITIRQLARVIRVITKSPSPIIFTDRPEHDHGHRMPSLGKVKKIGWYPTVSLRKGIALTLRKYTPE